MSGRSNSTHHPDAIRSELAGARTIRRSYLKAHPRAHPAKVTRLTADERFPSPAAVRRERDEYLICRCGMTCPSCATDTALQRTCPCFAEGLLFAANDDSPPTVLHSRCAGCRAYVGWHQLDQRWQPIDEDGTPHNQRCPAIIKRRLASTRKAP